MTFIYVGLTFVVVACIMYVMVNSKKGNLQYIYEYILCIYIYNILVFIDIYIYIYIYIYIVRPYFLFT